MAYSTKITCVRIVQAYLEIIAKNHARKQYTTVLTTDNPVKLAHKLRDAKHFLSNIDHAFYNNVFSHLQSIPRYSFSVERDKIIARLTVPEATEENAPTFLPVPYLTISDISDPLAVIGYILEHKAVECFLFSSLYEIPLALQKWADKNYYIISNEGEKGVQIKKNFEAGNVNV